MTDKVCQFAQLHNKIVHSADEFSRCFGGNDLIIYKYRSLKQKYIISNQQMEMMKVDLAFALVWSFPD